MSGYAEHSIQFIIQISISLHTIFAQDFTSPPTQKGLSKPSVFYIVWASYFNASFDTISKRWKFMLTLNEKRQKLYFISIIIFVLHLLPVDSFIVKPIGIFSITYFMMCNCFCIIRHGTRHMESIIHVHGSRIGPCNC